MRSTGKLWHLPRHGVIGFVVLASSCSPLAHGPDRTEVIGHGSIGQITAVGPGEVPGPGDLSGYTGSRRTSGLNPLVAGQAALGAVGALSEAAADGRTGTLVAHAASASVVARDQPFLWADEVETFANPTDRGGPLVFQALGPPSSGWIEVLLPIRPNGTTGWIPVEDVDLTVNPYRIDVDIETHTLVIERFGREQLRTEVAIGTGATPTPLGEFYLVELLRPSDPDGLYGPFAYGLSGYSETLESFNGGAGIIGIHGTNRPELIGSDVSHGCIRVTNPTIEEMVRFLPLGTPVRIHRGDDPIVPGEVAGDRT